MSNILLGLFSRNNDRFLSLLDWLFDSNGDFLVRSVGRDGISIILLDGVDVGVFVLFAVALGLAFEDTIRDNGENPEEAEENTNTTSENESDGSALPRTKVHQRSVETGEEIVMLSKVELMTLVVVVMVMWGAMDHSIIGPFHWLYEVGDGSVIGYWVRKDAHEAAFNVNIRSSWMVHVRVCVMMMRVTLRLDEWETKGLAEGIGDLNGLCVEAACTPGTTTGSMVGIHVDWDSDTFINVYFVAFPNSMTEASAFDWLSGGRDH